MDTGSCHRNAASKHSVRSWRPASSPVSLHDPTRRRTLARKHGRRESTMFIRNAWYVAAWADEIGEVPLARRICNESIVLFRDRQNRVAALLDMCCHRGAPLHMGQVVEEGIQCGYHGLVFDRAGTCVRVPGQELILERTRVRSFPVVEQDAFVWIWMGDPAKADVSTIVPWPYHNDAKNWPHKHTMYPIRAAAMLMVDN